MFLYTDRNLYDTHVLVDFLKKEYSSMLSFHGLVLKLKIIGYR